jgi:hypothetical protein
MALRTGEAAIHITDEYHKVAADGFWLRTDQGNLLTSRCNGMNIGMLGAGARSVCHYTHTRQPAPVVLPSCLRQ